AVSPASLDFGSVNIGQTKELELTVRNSGTAPLTVSSTSSSNTRFTTIVPAPPFTVSPGGAQPVRVRFTPASATAETGTLAIASNDTATPLLRVDLRGTGTSSGTGRTPACVVPPANAVSWWPGDGNANDLTGGNNGTLQGGATFAAGNVGQAFQFNGSATYVQL